MARQLVVGGNSSVSTLTVNNSTTQTFGGKLGGAGTNNNNLALVKNGKGGTADALSMALHAMGVEEAALGRNHVETTRAMHNLALVRLDRGEFNDALALHTRALEIRRRVRADNTSVADSLDLVALSLTRLRSTSPKPCPSAKRTPPRPLSRWRRRSSSSA